VQTIGNAAVGVGLGLSMFWVAVVVSQFATTEGTAARSASSPSASLLVVVAASTTPTTAASTASVAPTSSPATSPVSTASPTDPLPTATPTPLGSAAPSFTVEPYSNGGKRYAALTAPVGHVYLAPITGMVRVQTYQLIEGEVRVGSFVPSLPFFPYVTIESAERRVIYRPGALNTDTEMLIKDGERAEPGTPLFKTVGDGASSWRTFYDRRVAANVIVSVAALPSGAEIDPVAFFATR
jgi:hypothetical protein